MFFQIAFDVILPIFLVMGLGFLLSKSFSLDLGTLSKLNFYVFIPVFMFYSLLVFKPAGREIALTVLFNFLLAALTFLVMAGLTRALRFKPDMAAASILAVMVFNSANYGIPVVQLAFQGEGVAIQVITITAMNILTYTFGILIAGGWGQWRKGLDTIFKLPVLYALLAALALRALDLRLPDPVMSSLKWTSEGMLSIALITLGAQLGKEGITLRHPKELWFTIASRLILGPFLAFLLIHFLGIHGLLAKVLFVSSAFPTAVITVMFGIEYDKEPVFTADVAFMTTLLSAVTVTGAISLSSVLF